MNLSIHLEEKHLLGVPAMRTKITTLCPTCGPDCCPEIFVDNSLPVDKQVEITDDFGGKISMSKDQLATFVEQAKAGKIAA